MSKQETTRIFSITTLGPGTQLNGLFEIDEKIASGGMGEIFRGHEIMSGHPIAIKVVLSELAKDETIVGLFNKEARILRDLNHPAIVRYMAFGTDPAIGRPYLVMEFIDGPSLVDELEKGPLPLDKAKMLFARLAGGLDAAHQLGVIHRDISCDNVILANGEVPNAKIIDFGIARSTKSVTLLHGKFAGKYNYVSPEQLGLFNGEITEASDIYSFGLLMVNVLRGTPIDMNGTQVEIIEKRRTVPDISDIDESVRPVIELMLQPDPADRKVSMADIVDWFTPERERDQPAKPIPTTPPKSRAAPAKPPAAAKPADASEWTLPETSGGDAPADEGEPAEAAAPPDEAATSSAKAKSRVGRKSSDTGRAGKGKQAKEAPEGDEPPVSQPDEPAPTEPAPPVARRDSKPTPPAEGTRIAESVLSGGQQAPGGASPLSAGPAPAAPADPLDIFKPSAEAVAAHAAVAGARTPPKAADTGKSWAPILVIAFVVLAAAAGAGAWFGGLLPLGEKPAETTEASPAPDKPAQDGQAAGTGGQDVAGGTGSGSAAPVDRQADGGAGKPEAGQTASGETAGEAAKPQSTEDAGAGGAPSQINDVAHRLARVRSYDGGECFFARGIYSDANNTRIEGMGTNIDTFRKMEADFAKQFGVEPQIDVRPIEERQCAVASFLSALSEDGLPKLEIKLDSDKITSGQALRGDILGLVKPNTLLYLVDNDGFVYQLDQFLKRDGDKGAFTIKLVDTASRNPLPQMVLVLSSDKPIRGGALTQPAAAEVLLPKLAETAGEDGVDLEYSYSFFVLGGS